MTELLEQFKQKQPMYETMPDKYINGIPEVNRLNIIADGRNYNRILDMNALVKAISKDLGKETKDLWNTKFPIKFSMIHNDTEIRVVFYWGSKERRTYGDAQLDMSFDDYAGLPSVKEEVKNS